MVNRCVIHIIGMLGTHTPADATHTCEHGFLRTETIIIVPFSEKFFNRQNKSITTKFSPLFEAICTIFLKER